MPRFGSGSGDSGIWNSYLDVVISQAWIQVSEVRIRLAIVNKNGPTTLSRDVYVLFGSYRVQATRHTLVLVWLSTIAVISSFISNTFTLILILPSKKKTKYERHRWVVQISKSNIQVDKKVKKCKNLYLCFDLGLKIKYGPFFNVFQK